MSRYDTSHMMSVYTDDFGNTYNRVPFKIQKDAPCLNELYDVRVGVACAGNLPFTTRRLVATYEDGRKLIYPIDNRDNVVAKASALIGCGAVCLDYIGEKWGILTGNAVGGALNYRSTEYSGLISRKTYESGNFEYTSDLALVGLDVVRLPVRIPNDGEAELIDAQRACMVDFQANAGICAAAGLIEPRYLIIQARASDGGSVIRKARVSAPDFAATCAISIASAASCLGYQGESVPSLHNLTS